MLGARFHAKLGPEGTGEVREVLEADLVSDGGPAIPRVKEAAGRVGEPKPQEELMRASCLTAALKARRKRKELNSALRARVARVCGSCDSDAMRRAAAAARARSRADLRQRRLAVDA